ncbi:MAG: Na+/H+ antiporter NhaC family protein [Candidatus Sericytochromatia bacterium]
MRAILLLLSILFFNLPVFAEEAIKTTIERRINAEIPPVSIKGVKSKDIKISVEIKNGDKWELDRDYKKSLLVKGIKDLATQEELKETKELKNGEITLSNITITDNISVSVKDDNSIKTKNIEVFFINGIFSIMPPVIAIILAFLTQNVILSLFSGIIFGLFFIYQYNILSALIHFFDKYLIEALVDKSHMSILLFCLILGGIIKLIGASGGVEGIVNIITKYANTRKLGIFSTWLMGLIIFFDDYASALLVGNTMRPYTDSLKISREKLSYLVDTMAAPVSCMAIISTWIGFQLGQIDIGMQGTDIKNFSAYSIFLYSLPYNFYCIFTIIFALLVSILGKDFGSMLKAEVRAIHEGKVFSDKAKISIKEPENNIEISPKAINAIIPIFSIIFITAYGILYTGTESLGLSFSDINLNNLKDIMAASSTSKVLLWSGALGLVFSITSIVATKTMGLVKAVDTWVAGASSMTFAVMILTQAWVLASVCSNLGTNYYIINAIGDSLPLAILPMIVFLVSSIISFATGTSYGTMGIFFPLVVPLVSSLLKAKGLEVVTDNGYNEVFLAVIGAVFSGALFGDHCSPISDTTTMSAISTDCDMLDHFKTQLTYGITVLIISAICGFLAIGLGLSPILALILGVVTIFIILNFFGKKAENL